MSFSSPLELRRPIAKLELEDLSANPPTREDYFLVPGQILKFGRDKQSNDYAYSSASLSRNHFEIYSVVIEDDTEPMVYVRDRQSANGTFVNDVLIGKGMEVTPGRLLENGDMITIKPNWHFRVKLLAMKRTPLTELQLAETKLFNDQYTISEIVLGSGASTTVRLSYDVKTGQQLACKIYDIRAWSKRGRHEEIWALTRTLKLMTQLDHPNISSFKRAYKSQHTLFVFEELSAGGDLFSLVNGSIRLTELEIRWIMRQILVGLEYLHARSVAHRDIKLENVLLCVCPKPAHRIALTDFGQAELVTKGRTLNSVCGTPGWQAPELFKAGRAHGLAVDIWSMGIMAVHLLLGRAESKMLARVESTLAVNPDLETLDFNSIFHEIYAIRHECASDGPREDFLRRCLECDPAKRMTVTEALKHPYINEPASVRQLFQLREQENTKDWTGRLIHTDLIESLPDVLAPLLTTAKGKKEKTKPKRIIVIKNRTLKNDGETLKSPYFGKVIKSIEVKRVWSEGSNEDDETRAKRRKVVVCLD